MEVHSPYLRGLTNIAAGGRTPWNEHGNTHSSNPPLWCLMMNLVEDDGSMVDNIAKTAYERVVFRSVQDLLPSISYSASISTWTSAHSRLTLSTSQKPYSWTNVNLPCQFIEFRHGHYIGKMFRVAEAWRGGPGVGPSTSGREVSPPPRRASYGEQPCLLKRWRHSWWAAMSSSSRSCVSRNHHIQRSRLLNTGNYNFTLPCF